VFVWIAQAFEHCQPRRGAARRSISSGEGKAQTCDNAFHEKAGLCQLLFLFCSVSLVAWFHKQSARRLGWQMSSSDCGTSSPNARCIVNSISPFGWNSFYLLNLRAGLMMSIDKSPYHSLRHGSIILLGCGGDLCLHKVGFCHVCVLLGSLDPARRRCIRDGALERWRRGFCNQDRLAGVFWTRLAHVIPAFVENRRRPDTCQN